MRRVGLPAVEELPRQSSLVPVLMQPVLKRARVIREVACIVLFHSVVMGILAGEQRYPGWTAEGCRGNCIAKPCAAIPYRSNRTWEHLKGGGIGRLIVRHDYQYVGLSFFPDRYSYELGR
jgi:hypothetical protein